MIKRWLYYGIIFLSMAILGFFIVLFIYPFRNYIRTNNIVFLWYFLNDTTEGKDAGDYGRFKHNYIGYLKQTVFRNPHWNLKILLFPDRNLTKSKIKGDTYLFNVNKPLILGFNWCTYYLSEKKYFRLSFTKKFLWLFYVNAQLGAADNRYVYKFRLGIV